MGAEVRAGTQNVGEGSMGVLRIEGAKSVEP